MKVIKCKAWHKEQQKMYSAEELGEDQMTLMPDGRGFANISGDSTRLSQIDNGRKMIPLLYTGLKDKNAVEAYHKDILKDDVLGELWLIEWSDEYACFELCCITENTIKVDGILERLSACRIVDIGVIIGSIYENPELLEEKAK